MSPLRPDSGLLLAALRAESLLVGSPGGLPPITSLATDSRSVAPGALFIAVRGSQADGHLYLASAVAAGAAAVVVERPAGLGIPEIIVTDGGRAAIALARAWYGDPGRRLALVGVTGTSGKTTTTLLVSHLLNARGTAGSIGTLGAFDGGGRMIPSTAGSLTPRGRSISRRLWPGWWMRASIGWRWKRHRTVSTRAGSMGWCSMAPCSPISPASISTITGPWRSTASPS